VNRRASRRYHRRSRQQSPRKPPRRAFRRSLSERLGDPGGIRLTHNGRRVRSIGHIGQLVGAPPTAANPTSSRVPDKNGGGGPDMIGASPVAYPAPARVACSPPAGSRCGAVCPGSGPLPPQPPDPPPGPPSARTEAERHSGVENTTPQRGKHGTSAWKTGHLGVENGAPRRGKRGTSAWWCGLARSSSTSPSPEGRWHKRTRPSSMERPVRCRLTGQQRREDGTR
jgi:hypothetical protein